MREQNTSRPADLLEYPHLNLEALHITRLSKQNWSGLMLDSHFWRLYHNDDKGAGVWIKGKKFELLPDKLYLLPPHCQLRTWCSGAPIQLYVHFELTRISGGPDVPLNEIPMDSRMASLIRELRSGYEKNPLSARLPLLAIALASGAMVMLDPASLSEMNPDQRITFACESIRRRLAEPLTLEQLASEAGLVPNAFLRKFREITGSTPYQYILTLRYAMAARLLKKTSLSIDSICEQIGVNDRFHFSRKFKTIYGIPPGAYRKISSSFTGE